MASEPWFKFYAADYLLDSRVDSLPLEARTVLLAMWCLCHIEGACPADPEEIARKTRLPSPAVTKYIPQLSGFFELRNGRLYSHRMEQEKLKSEAARTKAQRRWHPSNANGNASSNSECNAQSQSQKTGPPPLKEQDFDLSLQKKESKTKFSQADFDARDLRKLSDAFKEIDLRMAARVGDGTRVSEKEIFEWACCLAGISIQRGLEVQDRGKKWPEGQTVGASA
jgi:hypothetical protein